MPPKRSVLAATSTNAVLNPPNNSENAEKSMEKPTAKATAKTTAKSSGNKRKASEMEPQELVEIDDEDPRLEMIDQSCDTIRRKINNLINSGEMKVGAFQDAIGVSSRSYSGFMGKSGTYGGDNFAAYGAAFAFFKKRELQGIKEPKKKVAKKEESKALDLSGVELEGESTEEVPIHESCDEMRKKIRAYLKLPNITQAGFLREAVKAFHDGRKIQSKQLNDFLGKKGALAGNTSAIYYAAYVFFEKIRIRDGKPKSKHRLEMEKIYRRGVNRVEREDGPVWVMANEIPTLDKYGRLEIHKR